MSRINFSLPTRRLLIGSCHHSFKKNYVETNRLAIALVVVVSIYATLVIIAAWAYDKDPLKLQSFVLNGMAIIAVLAVLTILYFAFSPRCQKSFLEESSENQEP